MTVTGKPEKSHGKATKKSRLFLNRKTPYNYDISKSYGLMGNITYHSLAVLNPCSYGYRIFVHTHIYIYIMHALIELYLWLCIYAHIKPY